MTTDYSPLEALQTLCDSIPDWKVRLDELNGQIALRQIELARLEESQSAERPPTRSVRNKGSTESLRPKDEDENNPFSHSRNDDADIRDVDGAGLDSEASNLPRNQAAGAASPRPPSSSAAAAARRAAAPSPADSRTNSNPRPSPTALNRQSSHPTPPTQPRIGPAILRKRKTDSLVSGELVAPKYRTRSMIIVYYDSAVQTAFEELVKFVSGSRNMTRKGKMAVKMAEMRRAAELEIDADDEEEGLEMMLSFRRTRTLNPSTPSQTKPSTTNYTHLTPTSAPLDATDSDPDLDETSRIPSPTHPVAKLRFLSTRQMGPSRDTRQDSPTGQLRAGALRGYRGSVGGGGSAEDVFDELDKGLEWCQSQCEHAAHQFLRDGQCEAEIENIKRRLEDVKGVAEREIERLRKESQRVDDEAGGGSAGNSRANESRVGPGAGIGAGTGGEERKGRGLKAIQMRRDKGKDKEKDYPTPTANAKTMEVDAMEVDDEGIDDMDEAPPLLVFKRAGELFGGR